MDSKSNPSAGGSGEKFTKTNILQSYVSFTVYLFDILSFILVVFVIVPLSKAIYPSPNTAISLLVTWGGFAAGSVTRPFGAALLAPFYDRAGRKKGIMLSLVGTAVFTALIGAIPTYAQIGDGAPIIYVALRLISGFFIGSLISGGLVFGPENVPEKLRGLMTGFAETGANWAHVVAAVWLLIAGIIFATTQSYDTFGWRFFFMVALIPLIVVLPVLFKVEESEIHVMLRKKSKSKESVYKRLFSKSGDLRHAFMLGLITSIGLLGYDNLTENTFPSFLAKVNHVPHVAIASMVILGGFGALAGTLLGGAVSQKTGRKPVAIGASVILIALSALFLRLGTLPGSDYWGIMLTILPLYFVPGIAKISLSLYLNESFPTSARATGLGLNWNIGYGLAGVWPLIILAYVASTGSLKAYPFAQFIALLVLGLIYLGGAILSKETRGNIAREKQELATGVSAVPDDSPDAPEASAD